MGFINSNGENISFECSDLIEKLKEDIKKSDLTKFAKDCVYAHEKAVKLMCISEDIMRNQIGKELINDNQNILLEVSKRFAKYARENINIDLDNGEVQNLQNILNAIIDCCEENNWFEQGK